VHASRVLHRDIKPENVLLTEGGGVRLGDFGLAEDMARLSPGKWVGTLGYLSPEALQGADLDARSDLWALGVILFEMLAGARPFDVGGYAATAQAILERPAPRLPREVAAPLAAAELVQRLLAKDRRQRIASARELSEQLAALANEPSPWLDDGTLDDGGVETLTPPGSGSTRPALLSTRARSAPARRQPAGR
jgi:serine/threonine protein kinase